MRNWRFALYEALVEHHGESFAPVLAESWRCSPDARTWTFNLRQGVLFHDGKPLTARDVAHSLTRAAGPLVTGELFTVTFHSYLAGMELETVDDRTILLKAPEPMADLLELLCDLVIIPEGALSDRPLEADDPSSAQLLPPGTGPYRLESFSQEVAVLRSWAKYWRGGRKKQLVEFREVPEEKARVEALKSGKAEMIAQLSPSSTTELDSPGLDGPGEGELWPVDSNLCVIYLMNLNTDYLRDMRMRRALNYAADKRAILREILHEQGKALNGPLSNLHFGFDPEVPLYPYDPEKARKLLAQAGLLGQELLLHSPLSLPDEAPRLTEMLAEQFKEIGIDTHIELHEDRFEYARKIAEKQLHGLICFDSSPLSTFRVLREKLDSRFPGPWRQGYHSEGANELLSLAAATPDSAARQALYRQAYRIYRDEAPWLYLYQPNRLWGIRRSARSLVRANREAVLRFE